METFNGNLSAMNFMSHTDNKAVARKFVQAIFNEGKIDEVKNFVTPDIIYHGLEEVQGIFHFQSGKIKEAWTIFDALTPALLLDIVTRVQPASGK